MEDFERVFGSSFITASGESASSKPLLSSSAVKYTPFHKLTMSSGSQGPIVGQVVRIKFIEQTRNSKKAMFSAWLIDLSQDSQHLSLGARRIGKTVYDEMWLQAWGSDALSYNRALSVGCVVEVQNYTVRKAYQPQSHEHPFQLNHRSYGTGLHTTFTVSPPRVKPLTTGALMSRIYARSVKISKFCNWEPTEGPEKWNTYTFVVMASYVGDLCPPSDTGRYMTRKLTVIDDTNYSINVMLIGEIAEKFSCVRGDILLLYKFQLSDMWERSLKAFGTQACIGIVSPLERMGGGAVTTREPELRNACLAPYEETNTFCSAPIKRLEDWRMERLGDERSLATALSNRDLTGESNYKARTLRQIQQIETQKLDERTTGPVRHVLYARVSKVSERGMTQMVCSEKGCSYRVTWVEGLRKWVCANPRVSDPPRIPGFTEEQKDKFRLIGHTVSKPTIRFNVQGHVQDQEHDSRFVFFGDNAIHALTGLSAESWITSTFEVQRAIRAKMESTKKQWWKLHASSSYSLSKSSTHNPIQMRVISMERCDEPGPVEDDDFEEKDDAYGRNRRAHHSYEFSDSDDDDDDVEEHRRVVVIKTKKRARTGSGTSSSKRQKTGY